MPKPETKAPTAIDVDAIESEILIRMFALANKIALGSRDHERAVIRFHSSACTAFEAAGLDPICSYLRADGLAVRLRAMIERADEKLKRAAEKRRAARAIDL
jgi:hypothetical protein